MSEYVNKRIIDGQRQLWEQKLERHGNIPQAVGSESIEHKQLRYRHISNVFYGDTNFSLLDVGAGVGDYFGYLSHVFPEKHITYQGAEITPEFCRLAREKHSDISIDVINILDDEVNPHDYVVLSGIFHQRGEISIDEWHQYMEQMLIRAFQISTKGIAFNVLSHHAEYERVENFYVNLTDLQDFVVRRLSRFYILDHAYPLFEATLSIYQPNFIRTRHPSNVFAKYMGGI